MTRPLALLLLLTGCASTQPTKPVPIRTSPPPITRPGPTSCNPPARFDHAAKGQWEVVRLSDDAFVTRCPARAVACTSADRRYTYIRANLSPAWNACAIRHERGHHNGWTGEHEQ